MSAIDATPILKTNIAAMDKKPIQFRASWRMAVSEVNLACKGADLLVKKGTDITLVLPLNMLLRAPAATERLQSTRVKMETRFKKKNLRALHAACG